MRILILTSLSQGIASRCLPLLCEHPEIEVAAVVLAETHTANKKRLRQRKLRKIRQIGILGALNGIRMRRWYADATEDIATWPGCTVFG